MTAHRILVRFVVRPAAHAPRLASLRRHVEEACGAPAEDVTDSAAHDASGIVAWVLTVEAPDGPSAVARTREMLAAAATGTQTCTTASVTVQPPA